MYFIYLLYILLAYNVKIIKEYSKLSFLIETYQIGSESIRLLTYKLLLPYVAEDDENRLLFVENCRLDMILNDIQNDDKEELKTESFKVLIQLCKNGIYFIIIIYYRIM